MAQRIKKRTYDAYKEAKKARRWDPDRECYLDPEGNICIDPSIIDLETLMKSILTAEEQIKINDANNVDKERLKEESRQRYLRVTRVKNRPPRH
ncbi:hypothetical protein Hanom_Chr02g00114091 [Helianthus anomalus]